MMKSLWSTTGTSLLVLLASLASANNVLADSGIKIGVLTCKTVEGTRVNLLIHSTVDVSCVFDDGNNTETYKGETGIGLGIDLNIKKDATMIYSVFSISKDTKAGAYALAGRYGGAKAAVTVGIGAGAAILVGGGDKNISLQPLALEGSTGLGAQAGLAYLYLEPSK